MRPGGQQTDPPADEASQYDLALRQSHRGLARVLRRRHVLRSQARILHYLRWTAIRSTHRHDLPTTLGRIHGLWTGLVPEQHPVLGWLKTPFIAVAVASSPLSSLCWWQYCALTSCSISPLPGTLRASCTVQIQSNGQSVTRDHPAFTPSRKIFDANPGCRAKILPRIM